MTFSLCELWPYLAGGLIGWLLAGWFARRLKHVEPPVERIIEKHIDKVVDNPEHLALIGKLQRENSQLEKLRSKINRNLESKGSSVDQTEHLALVGKLEKETNQVSLLTSKLADLESANKEIPALKTRIKSFDNQQSQSSGKTVEVEKLVDNPAHLKRITELEGKISDLQRGPAIDLKAAKAAGLAIKTDTDFTVIEGIGPKINDLIHAGGITSFSELANSDPSRIQKILDDAGSSYSIANPGTWPDQANLAVNNRWPALKALQDVLDGGVYPDGSAKSKGTASNKNSDSAPAAKRKPAKKAPPKLDIEAAKAAGFKVKQNNGQDNFTLIEGIGPKINELIHNDGIHTFTELANTHVDVIQKILDNAGPRYKLAKPGTWPAQSDMAASNRWDSLKAWQDELDGGE